MTLQTQVSAVEDTMRNLVRQEAIARGQVELMTYYADSHWTVTVYPDGSARYGGYAEEARGRRGNIDELSLWELAKMLEGLLSRR